MPIREHPPRGSILICQFDDSFKEPEMVKPRPVIVLTPKITHRPNLCTVVCLSTTPPDPMMPYHMQLDIHPPLPSHFISKGLWVKGDMVYAVGFHRLDLIRMGKTLHGKRMYYYSTVSDAQLRQIQACVLHGMGLSRLTKHL